MDPYHFRPYASDWPKWLEYNPHNPLHIEWAKLQNEFNQNHSLIASHQATTAELVAQANLKRKKDKLLKQMIAQQRPGPKPKRLSL